MLLLHCREAAIRYVVSIRAVDVQPHVSILVCPRRRPYVPRFDVAYASYNLRRKDIDVIDIAYHRAVAVIVGVIWAAIVSRFWWPTEARRALSKALGEYVNWC